MVEKIINIKIENYDGPFDLLLSLIQNKKLNILDINLVEVANEYVKMIEQLLNHHHLDLMSEYLLMAATLINLKAKILLKLPNEKKVIETATNSLLNRLSIYQKFKNIAQILKKYELSTSGFHHKKQSNIKRFIRPIDESKLDGKGNPIQLIIVMRKMFERIYTRKLKQTTIEKFNLSPAERRQELLKILQTNNSISWDKIFAVPSINHYVLTWITLLDMARKQEVILSQDKLFGPIKIKKGETND